jgi:hypothetical protein
MSASLHCLGALALELSAEGPGGRATLEHGAADQLVDTLGDDLRRLLPGVETLDAGFACALFDPAELLRPGWPVHAALAELGAAAPGRRGGRMIAFGAQSARMPASALQPDPALAGGLLRLLPFALVGDAASVRDIGQQMEASLMDVGMAGAQTALDCQAAFGVQLEHARWMSLHDLCAMTAMQYEHAGLAGCWRLIEAALLAPDSEEWLREDGEPLALYRQGSVRIAKPASSNDEIDPRQAQHADLRVRQLRAILAAHGVTSELQPVAAHESPDALLRPSVQ